MTVDERRWEHAWLLVSLDLVREFFRDLWLLIPEPERFQIELRQQLEPAFSDRIEYATNYGAIHYRLAEWLRHRFGDTVLRSLIFWVREILQYGGVDRQPESQWTALMHRLAIPRYDAPAWIEALCRHFKTDYGRAFDAAEARIGNTEHAPLSPWDSKTLREHEIPPASIRDSLSLMSGRNIFLMVWEKHCSGLTFDQLAEIHRHGQRIAEAPEIQLKRRKIVFPGIWRFQLAGYLEQVQHWRGTTPER